MGDYPQDWVPILDTLMELMEEYAPGAGTRLMDVTPTEDGAIQIWLEVPWQSDVISSYHKFTERALTKLEQSR